MHRDHEGVAFVVLDHVGEWIEFNRADEFHFWLDAPIPFVGRKKLVIVKELMGR